MAVQPPRPVESFLPLKPVEFQILMSLADGEQHGYAITRDIAGRTAARMTIEPGNLYRSLSAMLDFGLIEESERRPAPDRDDARRRYYRMTRLGRRVAVAETERLAALVDEARRRKFART